MAQATAGRITNAYVSVEIKDSALQSLREGLKRSLEEIGIPCEVASHDAHVSIAYGDGEVEVEELAKAAREITCRSFVVNVDGFEILEGHSTPFDYLVLRLAAEGDFADAVRAASGAMSTKNFAGGLHSHVSLLKFAKGALAETVGRTLVREMNASQSAAFALGCRPCLRGNSVSVFDPDRKCCLQVPFEEPLAP